MTHVHIAFAIIAVLSFLAGAVLGFLIGQAWTDQTITRPDAFDIASYRHKGP
jgi:hypothetical protein